MIICDDTFNLLSCCGSLGCLGVADDLSSFLDCVACVG